MGILSSLPSRQTMKNDIAAFTQRENTGIEIVRLKLSSLGYDKQLMPKDFEDLAYILSNKEALMNWYLHTDFSNALEMKQRMDRMAIDTGESIHLTNSISQPENKDLSTEPDINIGIDSVDTDSIDTWKCSQHNTTKQVNPRKNMSSTSSANLMKDSTSQKRTSYNTDDEADLNLKCIYDQLNTGSLRIKLIVAETSRNVVERSIKRLASPFINLALDNPPEFGFFHIALTIGCWKIEWNNSSLCIPRAITGKSAVIAADIESIATLDQLDQIREKLAEVIVRWNTTMFYQQSPSKDTPNRGNCQYFIDDVLNALGLSETVKKFPKPLKNYLRQLRIHGASRMEFDMSKEFRTNFNITEKKVIFKSHEQLDLFFQELLNKCPNFQYDYKYEYYMLKSFDRAFWMRQKSKVNTFKNCQPLVSSNGEERCPFGDPTQTSILQFRVKRSDI